MSIRATNGPDANISDVASVPTVAVVDGLIKNSAEIDGRNNPNASGRRNNESLNHFLSHLFSIVLTGSRI